MGGLLTKDDVMNKILMVRSTDQMIEKNLIGYGWQVDFSQFSQVAELLDAIKTKHGTYGNSRKRIASFFNLKKGDIVVVPTGSSIALAEVEGERFFQAGSKKSSNQISVQYCRNQNGGLIKIPRKLLTNALESRLKIRTSIADLQKFDTELMSIFQNIKKNNQYIPSHIDEKKLETQESFKVDLLAAIKGKKTWLESGGIGVENLVVELLQLDGYTATVQPKNQSSDIADVDIIAIKATRFYQSELLIQVKHHSGHSGEHGIRQLIAYDSDNQNANKWFITTAEISDSTKGLAENHNISTMDGEALVDWLVDSIDSLAEATMRKLGIIQAPVLVLL